MNLNVENKIKNYSSDVLKSLSDKYRPYRKNKN